MVRGGSDRWRLDVAKSVSPHDGAALSCGVLIFVSDLVDRARQPRVRAVELGRLRRQLAGALAGERPSRQEREAASRMRELRQLVTAELGEVDCCGQCTRGCARPQGIYDGGHCCSGNTSDVFNANEIAALAASGTRLRHLRAPREQLAGCAFRGPRGCSLDAADRPNVCAMYICRDLRRELFDRARLDDIEAVLDELGCTYERFVQLRAARLERAELAAIHPDLAEV